MDWFEAARTGALETLDAFLGQGQDVDQPAADEQTALRLAAEAGQTAVVQRLLAAGADPNREVPGAGRPLRAALENEHWDTAAALVRGGADPNADGVASIVIAAPPKRQLFQLMLKRGLDPHGGHPQWGPYVQFALNDDVCCAMLFEAGFDLSRYERETGESLLERALSSDVTRFHDLLERGANVNLPVERRSGRTMLIVVVAAEDEPAEQRHELIRLLVKRGAAIDQADAEGKTSLDHARALGDEPTVALLAALHDEELRARQREAEARAKAEAKARAIEKAKATRARNAAAKKAEEAKRAAAAKRETAAKARARAARKAARAKPAKRSKPKRSKPAKPSRPPKQSPSRAAKRANKPPAAKRTVLSKRATSAKRTRQSKRPDKPKRKR